MANSRETVVREAVLGYLEELLPEEQAEVIARLISGDLSMVEPYGSMIRVVVRDRLHGLLPSSVTVSLAHVIQAAIDTSNVTVLRSATPSEYARPQHA